VLSSLQKLPYGFVAALTGVMAFPLPARAADEGAEAAARVSEPSADHDPRADPSADSSAGDDEETAVTPTADADESAADSCLVKTICSVKQKIRWQSPAWTPAQCQDIADAVAVSSRRYDLSPTLVLAVMINESDMNEKAFRVTTRAGKVYAKDGGLMAIRCVLDRRDRCVNGNVRGMAWKQIMDPVTNIEAGARELAYWRDGGGVASRTVHLRGGREVVKDGPCHHLTHAWWAHYNHGPRYIDKGYPRHYPHRIAVLDHALATVMNVDPPELKQRITIHDPGKRERRVDRPLEQRFKKLYDQILSSGSCSAVALN
jgi:Transglycosylase SLT domain